jgi:hypothetical protein
MALVGFEGCAEGYTLSDVGYSDASEDQVRLRLACKNVHYTLDPVRRDPTVVIRKGN